MNRRENVSNIDAIPDFNVAGKHDTYYIFVSISTFILSTWSLYSIITNYEKSIVNLNIGDVLPFILLFCLLLFSVLSFIQSSMYNTIAKHGYVLSEKIDGIKDIIRKL